VSVGDWFNYEFAYSYNDLENTTIRDFEIFSEAEYIQVLVTFVEGIEIGYKLSAYFENGTILDWLQFQYDLSGESSSTPLTTMYQSPIIEPNFVAANLDPEDTLVLDGEESFTGSYNKTFSGNEVQINYQMINITHEAGNYISENHYEKVTGAPTYIYEKENYSDHNYFREYSITLVDSNVSIIPEFSSWLVLTLFVSFSFVVLITKKKIKKKKLS
jgi:hypothetical protein